MPRTAQIQPSSPEPTSARGRRAVTFGALLAFAAASAGCDNPACVFGPGNCRDDGTNGGGPGGIGTSSAVFPNDASWLAPAAPRVVDFGPDLADLHVESPVFIEFDQSLDAASLDGAFEVVESLTFQPVPFADPPALVGDGRVVVIAPAPMWGAGRTFTVRFTDDQEIVDVTGQAFTFGANQDLFEFGVTDMPPTAPRVLYTYPAHEDVLVSDLTEFVVFFDRRMDSGSFSNDSFVVTVNGVAPDPNPAPSSLLLTGGQLPLPVLQIWRWSSVNSSSIRQSLGADADVRVRLSPSGEPLRASGGAALATTDIDFTTASFRAPQSVVKSPTAAPPDAVGGPNLAAGEVLRVTLADAANSGDSLEVFAIGGSPANAMLLKAEQRTVSITAGATTVALGEAELDLREPNGTARFRDGELEFMVRLRRGNSATVARRTDGDTETSGFQRLLLDLTAPTFLGLGPDGDVLATYRSELGGLVFVGRGDEDVSFARVSTSLGDNFAGPTDRPRTALSTTRGLFVTLPVPGVPNVLDASPAITYTVELFDRALNPASQTAVGTFTQVGVIGPGAALPGPSVDVRVFDGDSLEPVVGAFVQSHERDAGVVTFRGSGTTSSVGATAVPSALAGATIVTVQATGYDSFTFHGVPNSRLDVPLVRAGVSLARISGVVQSPVTADFSSTVNRIGDSRFPQPGPSLGAVQGCGFNTSGLRECDFGPLSVAPGRVGLTTFFATDPNVPQQVFAGAPFLFLRGFAVRGPEPALGYGENDLDVDLLVDITEQVASFQPHLLDAGDAVSLGTLAGPPILTVEAFAPGLEGTPTIGLGVPYSQSTTSWAVLGATPLLFGPTGRFVEQGAFETDHYLRAELVDRDGNRVGARPRFSSSAGNLEPFDVPQLTSPVAAGTTGGDTYTLTVADVFPVTPGSRALYRVTLTDTQGRRWQLWAFDRQGAGDVELTLPPVGATGGFPLSDGAIAARVSMWSSPFLAPDELLWADVERRAEHFGHAAQVEFVQD